MISLGLTFPASIEAASSLRRAASRFNANSRSTVTEVPPTVAEDVALLTRDSRAAISADLSTIDDTYFQKPNNREAGAPRPTIVREALSRAVK